MSLDCKLVPVSSTVRIRISSISIDICYFSVYSLVLFRLREDVSNTQDSVSLAIQHLQFRQKYAAARRIFNSLLGVCIDIPMKHCLSFSLPVLCLIYYLSPVITLRELNYR